VAGQAIDPDRDALLRALHQSGAAFVVIGGAAKSHGLAYTTQDIDVTPARSKTNLQRLATTSTTLTAVAQRELRTIRSPTEYRGQVHGNQHSW
jgi:hypothetical protein